MWIRMAFMASRTGMGAAKVASAREPAQCPGCMVEQAGVEGVEKVDRAGVADGDLVLAGAQGDGLQEVTLPGAAVSGEKHVLASLDEAQRGERFDGGAVGLGLERPLEGFERLSHPQSARGDAALDSAVGPFTGGRS